jgi:DNA polymerase-3 subunit delta'
MIEHLFGDVIGQHRAIATLESSVSRPVHAYLFVGPAGTGKAAAAASFAAALLCPTAGDHSGLGLCDSCRRVVEGQHPDVIAVEREGASIGIGVAREVTRLAHLSPVEGARKIIVLHDFHLVKETGPALLKTIEEPPPTTVFLVLAEFLPPELVTIASRCVQIDFEALSPADVIAALVGEGTTAERAAELAAAAGGRLDRARLLAADPQFELRRRTWGAIPDDLDGTNARAAAVAERLIGLMDESVAPLRAGQGAELQDLSERNRRNAEITGPKKGRTAKAALNAGVSELEDRHGREQRRQRTDELRSGLAALSAAYRGKLASGDPRHQKVAIDAVRVIDAAVQSLQFNPSETIALQALLARLSRLAVV